MRLGSLRGNVEVQMVCKVTSKHHKLNFVFLWKLTARCALFFIAYRLYLFWQTWTFSHQIEEMLPSLQRDKATFDTIHAKLCRSLVYRERSDVFGKPDHVVGMLFVGIQRLQAKSSPEKVFPSPLCQDLDCPGTIPGLFD